MPIERLSANKELFARIEALRYSFAAYFGQRAKEPFQMLREVHIELTTAAAISIQMTGHGGSDIGAAGHGSEPPQSVLFGGRERPDRIDRKIEEAIATIEGICKPILEKAG